jgi:hypothetical protein
MAKIVLMVAVVMEVIGMKPIVKMAVAMNGD